MDILLNPNDLRNHKPTVYAIADTPANRRYVEDCIDQDNYQGLRKFLEANNTSKRPVDYWLKEW